MSLLQTFDQVTLKKFHQLVLYLEKKINFEPKDMAIFFCAIMITCNLFGTHYKLAEHWIYFTTLFYFMTFIFIRHNLRNLQFIADDARIICYGAIICFGIFFLTSASTMYFIGDKEITTDAELALSLYVIAGSLSRYFIEFKDFFAIPLIYALISCIKK